MNELTTRLTGIVRPALSKDASSVSYAIMLNGELLAADTLSGRNTGKPAEAECTYNVASISKIYCTVAVMQLVEQGKLSLDAPVAEYLPRFSMRDERFRAITLRHCLSHTSGLPGTQWRGFSVTDPDQSRYYDDVYDYLSKSTLKADPGAYAVYCNDGFTLAEMAVATVSGQPFAEYCIEHITEPIGAESTRLSDHRNPAYSLVHKKNFPVEQMLIQGAAGFCTSMPDLCRFGNLFLEENAVLSESSKLEMRRPQGSSFLKKDNRASQFGLGWDHVSFHAPELDLGENVLLKGGNSFQFDSMFLVIPRYRAVLAMSETHDCGLDISTLILRLFATVMLERGVSLYRRFLPVPQELKHDYSGIYLTPSAVWDVRIEGAEADIVRVGSDGAEERVFKDLRWNGTAFEGAEKQDFFFEEHDSNRYLITTWREYSFGLAMKAKNAAEPPASWRQRTGRKYIVCNAQSCDLAIHDIMPGFRIEVLSGFTGVFVLAFTSRSDSGVYSFFEGCVHATGEDTGSGFLDTPSNGSRDLLDPIFSRGEDGTEYCEVASYRYCDAATLQEFGNQAFPADGAQNGVYGIKHKLSKLPACPGGRRIIVLSETLVPVYDSLFGDKYQPVSKGYLLLI
ncbi:MAG: serine hydrolase [Clostridiaceae bacterium]